MTQFVMVMFFVGSKSPYGFSLFRQMASSPVWMSQLDTKTLREAVISMPSVLTPWLGLRMRIPSITTLSQATGRSVHPEEFFSVTPLMRTLRHCANSTIGEGRRLLSLTRSEARRVG